MAATDPHPDDAPASRDVEPVELARPAAGRRARWFARWKPLSVWLTLSALALEALLLLVLAVVGLVDLLGGSERVVQVALALVVSALLGAWLLAACAVGLGAGRSWVRAPALTVQLLTVLVALTFIQGGAVVLGSVALVVGGATLVGLLSPPVARYTGRRTFSFDQD